MDNFGFEDLFELGAPIVHMGKQIVHVFFRLVFVLRSHEHSRDNFEAVRVPQSLLTLVLVDNVVVVFLVLH